MNAKGLCTNNSPKSFSGGKIPVGPPGGGGRVWGAGPSLISFSSHSLTESKVCNPFELCRINKIDGTLGESCHARAVQMHTGSP